MLGLARRAGKLSMGHDVVKQSVERKKALLLIFCSDASPRLFLEFESLIQSCSSKAKIIVTDITMAQIHFSIGYKAAVMAVEDKNFADRITQLLRQEENANDN